MFPELLKTFLIRDNILRNDLIIGIDGQSLTGKSFHDAVSILLDTISSSKKILLKISRDTAPGSRNEPDFSIVIKIYF